MSICMIVTDEAPFGGMLNIAKSLGDVCAVVLGSKNLADKVAASGVSSVIFSETNLPESKAKAVAAEIKNLAPKLVLASLAPGAKIVAGAVTAALDGVAIPNVTEAKFENDSLVVTQSALGGHVLETLKSDKPVVAFYDGEDVEAPSGSSVEIKTLDGESYQMDMKSQNLGSEKSGLLEASRVVSFGRGVKSKDDIALIRSLAEALNAEVGCSMPIADDLGWMPKECYIGRSGQKISPKLYFTVGISGAPQHLEGVRGAKIIVAVDKDPDARIFKSADYGIVGDLYEVIPAVQDALKN